MAYTRGPPGVGVRRQTVGQLIGEGLALVTQRVEGCLGLARSSCRVGKNGVAIGESLGHVFGIVIEYVGESAIVTAFGMRLL